MLEFFRRNLFINSLLLFPYTLLVRIESLLSPDNPDYAEGLSPFTSWLYSWIPSELAQNIVACFLVFMQAVYINRIVVKHRMANKITLWPGLVYILLCSLLPQYTYLSPILIANSFILMAMSDIFQIYKKPFAIGNIFNSGFFISLAAMIYFPYIFFLIAGFLGLTIIRSFQTKEMLQFLSGIVLPFFLFGTWTYYTRTMSESMGGIVGSKLGFPDGIIPTTTIGYATLGVIIGAILLIVLSYGKYQQKKSIQVQKKIDILYWLVVSSLIMLILSDLLIYDHLLTLAIPLAILFSMNLLNIKSTITGELIHLGVLLLMALTHFGILVL